MANIQNFYDYELTYTGKYINEFLGTNAIDTVDYYADLNIPSKVSDARITGYETEEKTSQGIISPEHSKIFYVINDGRIDETTGEIIDVDGVETTEEINGETIEVIKYKRGFYQFIGYWQPTPGISGSYTLHRYWKYIEELSDGGKVFPEGYTAPTQMGLIKTGDNIGNKTMKELFISALGKDGWQDMPKFSYSLQNKYLSDNTGNTKDFESLYQIGTTLNIYGLMINYESFDGKYLSTSEGTFTVPVIGSTADGTYTANTLSSGKGKTYSVTPTNGTKSGTIKLTFSSQETYSLTTIGTQTIVSSITGTQSYIDPSDSNKIKTINITGTNKSINVGQYPIYCAYLTSDPSANSTINNVDKIQKTLQTSQLQDNIEFTVPEKNVGEASYLYVFVSTLVSTTSCTLSILNPEKTSAAKLDKLNGTVKISTGSTGDNYNKFYAFRVSNQTSGNAYSNWYIKYNKK